MTLEYINCTDEYQLSISRPIFLGLEVVATRVLYKLNKCDIKCFLNVFFGNLFPPVSTLNAKLTGSWFQLATPCANMRVVSNFLI